MSIGFSGCAPFIVGMPRSGTTLLRLMLDAHPDLAIPLETHFLRPVVKLSGSEATSPEVLHQTITTHYTWPDFHLSSQEFLQELHSITPFSVSMGIRCFYEMYAQKFNKSRWGDKTPPYGFLMTRIHQLLPEAFFVHVVRDGRDAALSHRDTYFWRFKSLREHAQAWRERMIAFRSRAQEGAPCMEVRYEDLVHYPADVLGEICSLLELPYSSEMERFHSNAGARMAEMVDLPEYGPGHLDRRDRLKIHQRLCSPPDPSRIGRWKREMSTAEALEYQEVAGDVLEAFGYELIASKASWIRCAPGQAPAPEGRTNVEAPSVQGKSRSRVKGVSLTWVEVPYRPLPRQHMVRELDHWKYFEICRVELECGVTGFGETMLFYTWGRVSEDAIGNVLGRDAEEVMWDDSVGAGLQQALFDAVGKLYDLPVHRLLGAKIRDRVPLSWWAIDMPGEDWVAECREAIRRGYTSLKTKPRPWFDLLEQCRFLEEALPATFQVGLDFNGSLLDLDRAAPYLRAVAKYPNTVIFEEPIPHKDITGYQRLRAMSPRPIALHSGKPPMLQALKAGVCDGFVLSHGGASEILRQAHVAAAADTPFWLQQVGTGITAAFSLHFGAVASHAKWSATTCHQLYEHALIHPVIQVRDGLADVPDAPGLGVELDLDAVERFAIERFDRDPYPTPGQLIAIRWPSGATSCYAHARQYWKEFLGDRHPIYAPGVRLENIEDDGSQEWKELQLRAQQGGVHLQSRP